MRAPFGFILGLLAVSAMTGCGYTLQHTESPLLSRYGIRRVYVKPLKNDTFKPGVENLVYNELVKVVVANERIRLVATEVAADAVLEGTVTQASYAVAGSTTADQLFPTSSLLPNVKRPSNNITAATVYNATLSASFILHLPNVKKDVPGQNLWGGSFARSQPFPGNNQLAEFGTTSSLQNESEFDHALNELARSVMASFHESMLAQF